MKYMTFYSSCSYAGLANLLSFYGIDTEDRKIALEMGLPFLFDFEDGCYVSGPMLQSKKWFNLYLNTIVYTMAEEKICREQLCAYLRNLQYAMLGIYVSEINKHAVIYTGIKDGKFCVLNNKWEHVNEPDTLLLSEQELLERVDETVMVAVLNKTAYETVKTEPLLEHSISVLHSLSKDITNFCSQEKSAVDIRSSMNTLFRAILLDGITMLGLIGETAIAHKLKVVQSQFMNAVKGNKPLQLDRYLDVALLNAAISEYADLIRAHI
ncbi:MAG: hypothetical protein J1E43_08675 [Christensenellaceae bacterium]|nr:hypothetical protein [Christensenellaceae bacterium]